MLAYTAHNALIYFMADKKNLNVYVDVQDRTSILMNAEKARMTVGNWLALLNRIAANEGFKAQGINTQDAHKD